MSSNLPLGEQLCMALEDAAKAKTAAMRARRHADRAFDIALLKATGKNTDERKASARQDSVFSEKDTEAFELECRAIMAKSKADGKQVLFDEWRTKCATERAEMQLR